MYIRNECFFGYIPEKFRSKLIESYKTPYSTIEYSQSFYDEESLNCFSISEAGILIHVIIFTIDKKHKTVNILNRVFEIEPKYLIYFSNFIFNSKLQIDKIQVNHLINPIIRKQILPSVCKSFDEDYILQLPASNKEYLSCLSPNMRRHSKNYISKIERTFGSYDFHIYEKTKATEEKIKRIIEMNHLRMASKNIISGIDDNYTNKIIKFVRNFGFISVLEINDKIVAGLISYSIKDNYFVEELSSDPNFDRFNVGHTCLFLTIQECIERTGNKFHLLWGNNPYKHRFMAERVQLFSVTVFRTNFIKQKYKLKYKLLSFFTLTMFFKLIKRKIKKFFLKNN